MAMIKNQFAFVKAAITFGKRIQEDFPCIAISRIAGATHKKIAEWYNISNYYGLDNLSPDLAESAVWRAINGYSEKTGAHKATRGFKIDSYVGLLSNNENNEVSRKNQAKGLAALTPEQKKERQRASIIGNHMIPYEPGEILDVVDLATFSEYQTPRGLASRNKIAEKVNSIWGNNRTNSSIDGVLCRYRRRQKALLES